MIIVTQVFEFLVGSKADIDALDAVSDDKFGKCWSGFYISCLWFLWGNVSKVGATPLHFAVRWGSESIVKFILRKKVFSLNYGRDFSQLFAI